MKKLIALILVAAMVLSLAACGSSDTPSGGGSTPQTEAAGGETDAAPADDSGSEGGSTVSGDIYPNANPDGSLNLDTVALVDPDYDYSQNPRYQVCYIASSSTALYAKSGEYIDILCDQMNMEYMGFSSSEGDNDMYMTLLQQALDAGYDIFILDPDSTTFPTVAALMDEYPDAVWASQMSPARDGAEGEGIPSGGNLIHPSIGFSNYDAGWKQMEKLFEWMNETYPDADWSEVGCLSMDFSASPLLYERTAAALDYWAEYAPEEAQDNIFDADCTAAGITQQGAIDVCGPIISNHTDIKYWLVQGNIDDWAQGACTAIKSAGLEDTSCAVTFGGATIEAQWDAGVYDCFRYALTSASVQYVGTCLGACYAVKNGWATMETLWPSWVKSSDHGGEGHTYATFLVPTFWEDQDTYQYFLEWTDLYSGANFYDYDVEVSIDDFPTTVEVPEGYANT